MELGVLEYDFQSSVGYWLCVTGHAYERAMNEQLTQQGITYRQCQVLAWLALEKELSQIELASRMDIEPATLVRVLDRMQRDGLISRTGSLEDRRRNVIRPLGKAKPLWKKITATAERVRAQVTEGLTVRQIATFKDVCKVIQANLQAAEAPAKKKVAVKA
jgi:MarR family transcriptional regulator, transcriptional regulator for hemolysin